MVVCVCGGGGVLYRGVCCDAMHIQYPNTPQHIIANTHHYNPPHPHPALVFPLFIICVFHYCLCISLLFVYFIFPLPGQCTALSFAQLYATQLAVTLHRSQHVALVGTCVLLTQDACSSVPTNPTLSAVVHAQAVARRGGQAGQGGGAGVGAVVEIGERGAETGKRGAEGEMRGERMAGVTAGAGMGEVRLGNGRESLSTKPMIKLGAQLAGVADATNNTGLKVGVVEEEEEEDGEEGEEEDRAVLLYRNMWHWPAHEAPAPAVHRGFVYRHA